MYHQLSMSQKPAVILIETLALSLSSWAVIGYFFEQYSAVFVSMAGAAGFCLSCYRITTHYLDRRMIKREHAAKKKKAAEASERRPE